MYQSEIDFTGISLSPQNNRESEQILLENEERLSNNCRKIYDALKQGRRLNADDMLAMGMKEYRKRISDLKAAGIAIKENKIGGGCKEWFL